MADVELRGISKVFPGGITAVEAVGLTIKDGEFLALLGPSGSGKTTLLRMIAGLEPPTSGTILIGGRDVTGLAPRDRDVAMVFQNPALYPHLSVFDNLAFGLRARGLPKAESKSRVESAAGPLGLDGVLGRRPGTLSGGQKQRVALGRAIVRRPAVFLFDEPMSSLDPPLRASIRADLIDLHRQLGATMILVTHDQGEALALGGRVGVMGRGRLAQVGRPGEVYERPASRFVAGFVGDPPMNILPCEPGEEDGAVVIKGLRASLSIPDGPRGRGLPERPTGPVDLGLRPEHVVWGSGNENDPAVAWLPGEFEVVRAEFLGHETVVTFAVGASLLNAREPGSTRVRPGDRCRVGLRVGEAVWFDAGTGRLLD